MNAKRDNLKSIISKHNIISITSSILITICFLIYFNINELSFEIFIIFAALSLIISLTLKAVQFSINVYISHIAFAIIAIVISVDSLLQIEVQKPMSRGDKINIGNIEILFKGLRYEKGPNYFSRIGDFIINDNYKVLRLISPETRLFSVHKQQTVESAILSRPLYDIYLNIGEVDNAKGIVMVFASYRPMIPWLWFSGFTLFLCGLYATIKHRLSSHT